VLVFWWGRSPIESHLLASVLQTDVTTVYKMSRSHDLARREPKHALLLLHRKVRQAGCEALYARGLAGESDRGYVQPCGKIVRIVESRDAVKEAQ